jgi:hypothetical protein
MKFNPKKRRVEEGWVPIQGCGVPDQQQLWSNLIGDWWEL